MSHTKSHTNSHLEDYQLEFLELAIHCAALRFGTFTLKSGRISPYFFNSGLFNRGQALARLGYYYARAIQQAQIKFDHLYGPAYKGIPLVSSVAISYAHHFAMDYPYSFNRKEIKDHGEGGMLIGAPLHGSVMIIDDVITAGTAIQQSIDIIEQANARVAGITILLDRQERGMQHKSAVAEISERCGAPVMSVVTMEHLIAYVTEHPELQQHVPAMLAYRQKYGVGSP